MTYTIFRFFRDPDRPTEIVRTGLTLEEAQAHCRLDFTRKDGEWFDGYGKEVKDE